MKLCGEKSGTHIFLRIQLDRDRSAWLAFWSNVNIGMYIQVVATPDADYAIMCAITRSLVATFKRRRSPVKEI